MNGKSNIAKKLPARVILRYMIFSIHFLMKSPMIVSLFQIKGEILYGQRISKIEAGTKVIYEFW